MRIATELSQRVRVIEHTWIPLPDGQRLAARIFLPLDADRHPVPAILEYIPYRKRDLTRARDAINHPWLAGHGYACVRVDLRGSGESDGVLRDEYLEQELADGVEAIAWIARQPWCTGAVGMMGISWGGFNALQIAARRPEALGAIVTACSTDDTYIDNMHFMGGCLLTDNLSEATTMLAFNGCPPDPELVGERWRELWLERLSESGMWLEKWLRHQHRDHVWKATSINEDYGAVRCPVMAVSGWADGFSNAVFRLMAHLDVPRLGLIGPWSHKYPHLGVPGPPIGFLQEVRRWFDRWLKGLDTGIMDEPRLRVWMQDTTRPRTSYEERPGRWVAERAWPSERIRTWRLPLAQGRLLRPEVDDVTLARRGPRSIQSPLTVGLSGGKWCSYAAPPDMPGDQREEDGGSLVFETDALDEDVEVLGTPEVELELSANEPVAMVAVRLSDVQPDGKATRVSYGLLNLTHRGGHEHPEPLSPGERYTVRCALNGLAQTFRAGHRIRLSVSSSYWPLAWPPPRPARVVVYTRGSTLHLPCRPPDRSDERLRPFDEPEGAEPLAITWEHRPSPSWRVIHDLATDEDTLEVVRHDERLRIDEIDLTVGLETREWYRSVADDFTSASGETWTVRAFSRGAWQTRVETHTRLTATEEAFHVHAWCDAWEGGERVFSESWTVDVPRKLV